jgi:fumarate hydratase subunit alpha
MAEPREIDAAEITRVVRDLCIEINYKVPEEMVRLVRRARELEESPLGRQVLDLLIRNQELAAEGEYPYCQDTGYTVIFLDLGQDVHVTGADLYDAVNEGVRQGYGDGYLRGSIVRDPLFERRNTGDNTPAFIHTRVVPGDQIRIQVDAKGPARRTWASTRCSSPPTGSRGQGVRPAGGGRVGTERLPARDHRRGDRRQLRDVGRDRQAGADAQGRAAELRPADRRARGRALREVQRAGPGPEALGGTQTVLAVHVETMPTHIASLPVAVNIECHAHRTGSRVI